MKKAVTLLMLVVFVVGVVTTNAYAAETSNKVSGGAIEASKKEITEAERIYKIEERKYEQRENVAKLVSSNSAAKAKAATWYTISFPYYGQQKNMSCGPASARMMLRYITGSAQSEATIRNNMTGYTDKKGVTLNNLLKYVNGAQNRHKYTRYYGASQAYIFDGFLKAIKNRRAAPVAGVKEGTAYGFPYNISGHFIVVYAVKSDKSSLKIKDPWAGYKGHTKNPDNRTYSLTAKNFMKGYCGKTIGVGF